MPSRHPRGLRIVVLLVALLPAALALDMKPFAGPDAPTYQKDRYPRLVAQWKTLLCDSYANRGAHDPAWDAQVKELLELVVPIAAGQDDRVRHALAADLARRLSESGACTDPLPAWAAFYLSGGSMQERIIACNRAMAAFTAFTVARPNGPHHPYILHAMCLSFALGTYGREPPQPARDQAVKVAQQLAKLLGASIRNKDCAAMPAVWLHTIKDLDLNHQDFGEPIVTEIDAAVKDAQLEPWAADAIRGTVRIGNAWAWRGSGWAKSVTPEGWKGFERNLKESDDLLTKAWQANPKEPLIPAYGCVLAGADASTADAETWLKRSLQACFDHAAAFDSTINFLRPRWGGSYDKMLNLACDCVDTARFDTDVPRRVFEVIRIANGDAVQMKAEPAFKVALGKVRVQKAVEACVAGYVAIDPKNARSYAGEQAAVYWLAGRRGEAKQVLTALSDADFAAIASVGKRYRVDLAAIRGGTTAAAPAATAAPATQDF